MVLFAWPRRGEKIQAWKIARDSVFHRRGEDILLLVEHDNNFHLYLFFLRFCAPSNGSFFFSSLWFPLHTASLAQFFFATFFSCCCSYLAFTPIIIFKKSYNFFSRSCRAFAIYFCLLRIIHVNFSRKHKIILSFSVFLQINTNSFSSYGEKVNSRLTNAANREFER